MISSLKKALEEKIGFKIDSVKACRRLEQMLLTQKLYVSDTTLSRIFSVSKTQATPRTDTLNLLSIFLGYAHYEAFLNLKLPDYDEERYLVKSLELKSLLLNQQYYQAIDLMEELKNIAPNAYLFLMQDLGKAIFGQKEKDKKAIAYLLERDYSSHHFHEFFVYEDDPYGHFSWSIENINSLGNKTEGRILFENYYLNRKKLLRGEKHKDLIKTDEKAHYYIHSRYLELELLMTKNSKSSFEITDLIKERLLHEKDPNALLAYCGRCCRALLYNGLQHLLEKDMEWENLCLRIFQLSDKDLEFNAAIFAFLKKVYRENLPLDFYLKNRWENALLESELMLSMAFEEKKTLNNYRQILGFRV